MDATEFSRVWSTLDSPVQHQILNLREYPTERNQAYIIGMLWALHFTGRIDRYTYTYLVALAGQILDNETLRNSLKGYLQ